MTCERHSRRTEHLKEKDVLSCYDVSYDEPGFEEAAAVLTGACPNCGQAVDSAARFCAVCGWPIAGAADRSSLVSCPVCWSPNPATNRFCEFCAARLGLRPGYSPPRSGVGSPSFSGGVISILFGLAAVLFVVLLVVALGRGDPVPSSTTITATSTVPSVDATTPIETSPRESAAPTVLTPDAVVASSELTEEFQASNLADGDPETVWRDASRRGDGAALTFRFDAPITVTAVVVWGVPNDEAFHQSYRIRRFRLDLGGGAPVVEGEIPDSPEPFRLDLGGVETSAVTLEVVSVYPGEPHDGEAAADELAVAEVELWGR